MSASRTGIVLDSFAQPVKGALTSAARLGFRQVEMPAVTGEVSPAELSRTGRRHLLHYVSGLGLQLSALGGDPGGGRFSDSSAAEQHLDRIRGIIEMAAELRVPIVTTHLGRVDEETLRRGHLAEVVQQLGQIADRTGTLVAFETGSAEPAHLADLLRDTNCASLGACYDPATLLIDGFEPLDGVERLADRILIARARDAVAGSSRRPGRETPLGQGEVDFVAYLAALDQSGYRNCPFIRRAQAEHPMQEIADAKQRIEAILP